MSNSDAMNNRKPRAQSRASGNRPGRLSEHFQIIESQGPPSCDILERWRVDGWAMLHTTPVMVQSPIANTASVHWVTYLERDAPLVKVVT